MKKYSLKEIKELWRKYKMPVFCAKDTDTIESYELEPGRIVRGDVSEVYRFDQNMSFPEYVEYLEDLETERKIKKLQE
jgi:hypothetical protein